MEKKLECVNAMGISKSPKGIMAAMITIAYIILFLMSG
jgi:hypothetical protein